MKQNEARLGRGGQVKKNDAIFVPPNSKQFLENSGEMDLVTLCIVDPAWRQEDEISE